METSAAGMDPKTLTPSLRHGLRAVAIAGNEYEPFVDWVVDPLVLKDLVAAGLAEQGDSNRPSVGEFGYRLTEQGWQVVGAIWSHHELSQMHILTICG